MGWEQETVRHGLYTVGTGSNWTLRAGGSLAERLCKENRRWALSCMKAEIAGVADNMKGGSHARG